jgi:hypothetical protein
LKAFINRKTLISAGFAKNPKKRKKEKRINTKEAAKNNKELFSFFLFCEPGNFTLGNIVLSLRCFQTRCLLTLPISKTHHLQEGGLQRRPAC